MLSKELNENITQLRENLNKWYVSLVKSKGHSIESMNAVGKLGSLLNVLETAQQYFSGKETQNVDTIYDVLQNTRKATIDNIKKYFSANPEAANDSNNKFGVAFKNIALTLNTFDSTLNELTSELSIAKTQKIKKEEIPEMKESYSVDDENEEEVIKVKNVPEPIKKQEEEIKISDDTNLMLIDEYYTKALADKEKETAKFIALKNALDDFIKAKHSSFDNNKIDDDYAEALERVQDTARIFLADYKKKPSNKKLAARVENITNLKAAIDERLELFQARQDKIRKSESEVKIVTGNTKLPDTYLEVARMHKHIAPVKLMPKNPEHEFKPSGIKRFFRALGHYAYSAVNMVVGNTIGRLISNIARPFTQRNVKRPAQEFDTQLIPGGGGDKFENIVLSEDKDQPIISDIRRVPLVWEQPIPDNTNQPPTVSFNYSQGTEGNSESLDANGATGHAHVVLTYTKVNPLTGRPQRYRLGVGFYPQGGFSTKTIEAAQYLNGLRIPGTLSDDSDASYAIGKTFQVDNLKINKMLLFAQSYAKDGYNAITRNCSTFTADMAKVAGLEEEANKIMQKVDFTVKSSGANAAKMLGIGFGGMFVGPLLTRLAKRDILKKVDRDDLSYQGAGQKMLNAQDVKKLWSLDFNTRMKGYSPNHAAENIRHEKGSVLNSRMYKGTYYTNTLFNWQALTEETHPLHLETTNLVNVLRDVAGGAGYEAAGKVLQYCEYMNKALDAAIENIRSVKKATEIDTYYGAAYNVINEYIEGLNSIYQKTYSDNKNVNIPFNHMVSILSHIQKDIRNDYATMKRKHLEVSPQRDNCKLIQKLHQIAFNVQTNVKNSKFTNAQVAGYIKVFGSINAALKALDKEYTLRENSSHTPEYKKVYTQLDAALTMAASEAEFFSGREFTKNDYKFAFYTLPNALDSNTKAPGSSGRTLPQETVSLYQSEVFNHLIGDLRVNVQKMIKEGAKVKDTDALGQKMYNAVEDLLCTKVTTEKNKEIIKNIKEALIPREELVQKRSYTEDDEDFARRMDRCASYTLVNKLTLDYILPLLQEELIASDQVRGIKIMTSFSSEASRGRFSKLKEAVKEIKVPVAIKEEAQMEVPNAN